MLSNANGWSKWTGNRPKNIHSKRQHMFVPRFWQIFGVKFVATGEQRRSFLIRWNRPFASLFWCSRFPLVCVVATLYWCIGGSSGGVIYCFFRCFFCDGVSPNRKYANWVKKWLIFIHRCIVLSSWISSVLRVKLLNSEASWFETRFGAWVICAKRRNIEKGILRRSLAKYPQTLFCCLFESLCNCCWCEKELEVSHCWMLIVEMYFYWLIWAYLFFPLGSFILC